MIELAGIKGYLEKMTKLISIVLEMDVTVCDTYLQIIGDWSHETGVSEEGGYLKEDSVIATAMREKRIVIYDNAKEENEGCRKCRKRDNCTTEGIIAYPLVKGKQVVGGIGIYSRAARQKKKLAAQRDFMIDFLDSICQLILHQVERETANLELLGPVKYGSFDEIIGESERIVAAKTDAESFARSQSNILIQGESGTGKEVFAQAIHNASRRPNGPFVAVNCAAIPDNLLESELFGYVGGAFTGASKSGRAGKFEIASGGTLFLDEIGELPIHLQPKLLRVLQEKKIQKVGSDYDIDVDIRIIAATNRDLQKMMETGEFREDLYYRLSVIPIRIPPLRERRSDIAILAGHFLQMYKEMLEKDEIKGLSPKAIEMMASYDWPGNVRELQNAVEYAVNKCKTDMIMPEDIADRLWQNRKNGKPERPVVPLKQMEKEAIENALACFGNTPEGKEQAAQAMGISRATMYRKIKEYGL